MCVPPTSVALPPARPRADGARSLAVGTLAHIVRLERLSSQAGSGLIVVLSGLARFSYSPSALDPLAPFYSASGISVHNEPSTVSLSSSASDTALVAALRDSATSLVETLATTSTLPPPVIRRLRTVVARLTPSTAPALLDALVAALPVHSTSGLTHADKVALLGVLPAPQRIDKGLEVLGRADEALKLAGRIEGRVEEGQKRRQREWALLQQLMAIRQELEQLAKEEGRPSPLSIVGSGAAGSKGPGGVSAAGRKGLGAPAAASDADEDEDDLAELERRVAAKSFSPEAKRVAERELKRLKKTPPQGAEHGVIRASLLSLFLVFPLRPGRESLTCAPSLALQATTSTRSCRCPGRRPRRRRSSCRRTLSLSPARSSTTTTLASVRRRPRSFSLTCPLRAAADSPRRSSRRQDQEAPA